MKKFLLFVLSCFVASTVFAQPADDLGEWQWRKGAWKSEGDILTGSGGYVISKQKFKDVLLTAEAKTENWKEAEFGFFPRCVSAFDDCYRFILRKGEAVTLDKMAAKNWIRWKSEKMPLPTNKWMTIRISCLGSRIEVYLDGRKIFDQVDIEPLPEGYIVLWANTNAVAQFRNIRIQRTDAATEPEKKDEPQPVFKANPRCTKCDGRGKIKCPECKGLGYDKKECLDCGSKKIKCSSCDGKDALPCATCKPIAKVPRGRVLCPTCRGAGGKRLDSGLFDDCNMCDGKGHVACPECQGRGYKPCADCERGYRVCKTCEGKGYIKADCSKCKGHRYIQCPDCDAKP